MTDNPAGNALATTKNEIVDLVANKVRQFATDGQLNFPANYSPENALKSAWLILQETVDKDKRPVLSVCTTASVANSLLNMVVQGLNPAKKQCYFIAYGTNLVCQRSYFGTMAVTMRVDDQIEDIFAQEVYEGDEFEYQIVRGRKVIAKHVQKMGDVDKAKIVAAYCSVVYRDGSEATTIMTLDEIKQAWKQSQMRPVTDGGEIKQGSTHEKFTADMAKKTVINRACKRIVNASDDSDLVIQAFRAADQDVIEAEALEVITISANTGEIIDVPAVIVDAPLSDQPDIDWDAEVAAIGEGSDGPGF